MKVLNLQIFTEDFFNLREGGDNMFDMFADAIEGAFETSTQVG